MQNLFDFMRRYRREDGSELCETFVRAPKRRTEPEFYEVVSDPIDMLRIQQKLKMDEYTELKGLKEDFELLFKNALSYYKKGSQEFKDATEMSELFQKAFGKSNRYLVVVVQKSWIKVLGLFSEMEWRKMQFEGDRLERYQIK